MSGSRSRNRRLEVGRQLAEARRSVGRQLARGRAQLGDERVGVVGEAGQPVERHARLVARTSAGPGTSPAARWSRAAVVAKTRVGVGDQRAQLAVALASARRTPRRCCARAGARRACWRVEDLQQLVGVLRERREVAERVVDVAAPRPATTRACVCIQVWNACARLGVERAEDLVELDGRRDLRARQRARRRGSCCAPCVPGRQLDVGLAEQRLLAQDRLRVGRDRRVLGVELDRRRATGRSRRARSS